MCIVWFILIPLFLVPKRKGNKIENRREYFQLCIARKSKLKRGYLVSAKCPHFVRNFPTFVDSRRSIFSQFQGNMVIPPPIRSPRITEFLRPYLLKMHFTNKFVHAQVIHSPTSTIVASASSQEKALRSTIGITRDATAAAKIGKILGERLLVNNIPAVQVFLKKEQKYHGKIKAVIDNMRNAGVELL